MVFLQILTSFRRLAASPVGRVRQTPHGNPAVRTTGPASTATPVCNGSGANHLKLTKEKDNATRKYRPRQTLGITRQYAKRQEAA